MATGNPTTIRESEDALFSNWQGRECYVKSFVMDGVVDQDEWQTQETHVLFLLKEANGENWNGDLRTFLHKGGKGQTWNNIARWACGIISGYAFSNADAAANERTKWLRKIAVVNVKKAGGRSYTDTKSFNEFYLKTEGYRLLAEQLSLYDNLDYIICCGAGVKKCLDKALKEESLKNVWSSSKPIMIDFHHPQSRIKKSKLFTELMSKIATSQ